MREFFGYIKVTRLTNITRLSLKKIFAALAIFIFFNVYFFTGLEHNTVVTLFGPIMFIAIGIIINKREYNKVISLRNVYPMSTKKRQLYDILDAVLYATITFLLSIILFLIIALIVGDIEEGTETTNTTIMIYKYTFNISIFAFFYLLSSIKSNKNWWLTLLVGTFSYFILNILTRYILIGNGFKRITINLSDYSNILKSIYYFSVIGIFLISIVVFIIAHNNNRKPKKGLINI